MGLRYVSNDFNEGTLTLNFDKFDHIAAGVPYLVKWEPTSTTIQNPVFTNVTISKKSISSTSGHVNFIGTFSPITLEADDRNVLYLGADNTLYYPSADMTVGSCRAVFKLNGITAGDPACPLESEASC